MKIVLSEIKCDVCGETRKYQAEFDTEDETEARELHAESLKPEIIDFYAHHSSHEVENIPSFKPNGSGDDAKMRAIAAYCNWVIQNKYGSPTDKI